VGGVETVTVSVSVAWRRGDLHGNNIEILDRAAKLRAKVGFLVAGNVATSLLNNQILSGLRGRGRGRGRKCGAERDISATRRVGLESEPIVDQRIVRRSTTDGVVYNTWPYLAKIVLSISCPPFYPRDCREVEFLSSQHERIGPPTGEHYFFRAFCRRRCASFIL